YARQRVRGARFPFRSCRSLSVPAFWQRVRGARFLWLWLRRFLFRRASRDRDSACHCGLNLLAQFGLGRPRIGVYNRAAHLLARPLGFGWPGHQKALPPCSPRTTCHRPADDQSAFIAPRRRLVRLEPISKSFEEDNEAGKLDKAEEIVGVVLPTNEDPALPLNPGEEALDEPASHVAA